MKLVSTKATLELNGTIIATEEGTGEQVEEVARRAASRLPADATGTATLVSYVTSDAGETFDAGVQLDIEKAKRHPMPLMRYWEDAPQRFAIETKALSEPNA